MSEADDPRVKQIFSEAVERRGADRAAYLDGACAGDAMRRARVEALLAASERVELSLVEGTADIGPNSPSPDPARESEGPGTTIGPYRLLQLIGEGGFGSVFMAEQSVPLRRRVALKIIKLGMDTKAVIARFEAERQALALMDHPNIARVFDAGATESGRPFFVMELVKGDPITAYCDRHNLPIEERLELFAQVCRAIQHAHTKGVIHRDIKPGNVLVSIQDGKPLAKVIDFGIAKATSARLVEKTLFTEFHQLIGTPEYMSPEQAEGSLDIDTRTDVYALGVLLYELITGATPFDPRRLRSAAYDEMRRIIREDDPPKPSTRLQQATGTLASVAAHRRTEAARLGTLVRGDLDWIVMKCLDKDRGRRYETAEGLASDVGRHLRGEAVLAAPPGAAYKLRKFARRHRVGVVAGAAIAIALAAGAGAATAGYFRVHDRDSETLARRDEEQQKNRAQTALGEAQVSAQEARSQADHAQREASKARAVNDFLQQLLEGVNPEEAKSNRGVTVREVVDRAARRVDAGGLAAQPEIEASVRATLGRVYLALGAPDEAESDFRKALALGEKGALAASEIAAVRNEIGGILRDRGDLDGAERWYQETLDSAERTEGEKSVVVGVLLNSLAGIARARGRIDDAAEMYGHTLTILRETPDSREYLQLLGNMAVLAAGRGDPAEAERLLREEVKQGAAAFGEDDPLVVFATVGLGIHLCNVGRVEEAAPLLRAALAQARLIYGDNHPQTIRGLASLGGCEMFSGHWALAEQLFRQVMEADRAHAPDTRDELLMAMKCYSVCVEAQDRPADAEATRRALLDNARAMGSPAAIATEAANLGGNLLLQRRWADAEAPLRDCLTARRTLFPTDNPQAFPVHLAESMLGESLLGQAEAVAAAGDLGGAQSGFTRAEELLVPAAESLLSNDQMPTGLPDRRHLAIERVVRLYTSWKDAGGGDDKGAKAADWERRSAEYDASRGH